MWHCLEEKVNISYPLEQPMENVLAWPCQPMGMGCGTEHWRKLCCPFLSDERKPTWLSHGPSRTDRMLQFSDRQLWGLSEANSRLGNTAGNCSTETERCVGGEANWPPEVPTGPHYELGIFYSFSYGPVYQHCLCMNTSVVYHKIDRKRGGAAVVPSLSW